MKDYIILTPKYLTTVQTINTVHTMDAMNRMTAKQLIAQQGSEIHIFRNQRTGTVGFVCGSIQGRCTHRLTNDIINGNPLSINDLEYCVRVFPNTHIPELGYSRRPNIILTIG